jgi:hypothetical protein
MASLRFGTSSGPRFALFAPRSRGGSCFVLAFLCGCGFATQKNLDGLDLAGADFAGVDFAVPPGADLSVPPGADLSVPPGADLSVRPGADLATPNCPTPLLLVTVENVSGSANGGRVQLLTLGDGTNLPQTCRVLSAQGNLTAQPQSAAMVGGKLAVEGVDTLQIVDPVSDTSVWSNAAGNIDFPRDVFALKHPDGRDVIAAAWATKTSTTAVARVDGWALDGTLIKAWTLGTDLPLGLGITGMCSFPSTPTHLLAVDADNNQWAWDVDPWGATKTGRNGMLSGSPVSIYADIWMSEVRTTWTDTSNGSAVVYNNDANGTSLMGPIACMGCTLLDTVPDPTLNTRFFGLCDGPSVDARRVVIFKSTGGTCDTVLEGALFGSQSRLSRLAISQ